MKKVTETTVITAKGAELKVFIEDGAVKVGTPIGVLGVVSVFCPRGNVLAMTYRAGDKKMVSELKTGGAMVRAMLNCVSKPGRELYVQTEENEFFQAEGFGTVFEVVESSTDRVFAAYKYN